MKFTFRYGADPSMTVTVRTPNDVDYDELDAAMLAKVQLRARFHFARWKTVDALPLTLVSKRSA